MTVIMQPCSIIPTTADTASTESQCSVQALQHHVNGFHGMATLTISS